MQHTPSSVNLCVLILSAHGRPWSSMSVHGHAKFDLAATNAPTLSLSTLPASTLPASCALEHSMPQRLAYRRCLPRAACLNAACLNAACLVRSYSQATNVNHDSPQSESDRRELLVDIWLLSLTQSVCQYSILRPIILSRYHLKENGGVLRQDHFSYYTFFFQTKSVFDAVSLSVDHLLYSFRPTLAESFYIQLFVDLLADASQPHPKVCRSFLPWDLRSTA
jgi:hypothetical protein